MENIFIPSKNRIENSTLLKFVSENNNINNITIVVEPSEIENYIVKFPKLNFMVLPINNGGITYVRNYIKNYTEKIELDNYWQLDDDISGFFYRDGTKLIRAGFEILEKAKSQFIKNSISLGSLEYRQFSWSANKDIVENSFCDSCVYVDNIKLKGLRYNDYVEGKEDRDFAMQVIKKGLKTGRSTLFAFSAPPNGSNKGGLKEIFYDLGKEKISVERMVEIWGKNICKPIIKNDGRNDIKIMWNEINSIQTTLF